MRGENAEPASGTGVSWAVGLHGSSEAKDSVNSRVGQNREGVGTIATAPLRVPDLIEKVASNWRGEVVPVTSSHDEEHGPSESTAYGLSLFQAERHKAY